MIANSVQETILPFFTTSFFVQSVFIFVQEYSIQETILPFDLLSSIIVHIRCRIIPILCNTLDKYDIAIKSSNIISIYLQM